MRRLLRLALLCILALALPLQGMAAAAMTDCASGHHAAASLSAPAHPFEAGHEAHGLHHAGHPVATDAPLPEAAATPPAAGHDTQIHSPGPGCSACAACCAGFALTFAPFEVAAPDPEAGIRSPAPDGTVGNVEDAPERPPRASRA